VKINCIITQISYIFIKINHNLNINLEHCFYLSVNFLGTCLEDEINPSNIKTQGVNFIIIAYTNLFTPLLQPQ